MSLNIASTSSRQESFMSRRSRRPTRKAVALLAVLCFSAAWLLQGARVGAASSSASAAPSPPTYRFDIPAGSLESALSQFMQLTGASVTILRLDDELEALLDALWRGGRAHPLPASTNRRDLACPR